MSRALPPPMANGPPTTTAAQRFACFCRWSLVTHMHCAPLARPYTPSETRGEIQCRSVTAHACEQAAALPKQLQSSTHRQLTLRRMRQTPTPTHVVFDVHDPYILATLPCPHRQFGLCTVYTYWLRHRATTQAPSRQTRSRSRGRLQTFPLAPLQPPARPGALLLPPCAPPTSQAVVHSSLYCAPCTPIAGP